MNTFEHRQRKVEQLYENNYETLRRAALTDRSVYPEDAKRILEQLKGNLPRYNGPLTDHNFKEWSAQTINPAVARIAAFSKLKGENAKYVYSGIWSVLREATDLMDDYTFLDICDNVWAWSLEHLEELLRPGEARVSTRLYVQSYWQARAWKTTRLRAREKFVQLDHSRDGNGGQLMPAEEIP